jgi:predicted aldo/keto reductase-like oxidoreductase
VVDEARTVRLLRYAIDHGVNYIDTGYTYHGGASETVIGKALQDGYRDKVKVATKLPLSRVETLDDCDRFLDEQRRRLQLDSVDFYLLHALQQRCAKNSWPAVKALGILDWAEGAMAAGRFRHLGFSFYGELDAFRQIVDEYDGWAVCMIRHNYVENDSQLGRRGLEYAAAKGLAVAVMGPLRGGELADPPPPAIRALWDTALKTRTPADWALQWAWDFPQVSVIVSGMSTQEQVQQNTASARRSGPGVLTEEEMALIGRVRKRYRARARVHYNAPAPGHPLLIGWSAASTQRVSAQDPS